MHSDAPVELVVAFGASTGLGQVVRRVLIPRRQPRGGGGCVSLGQVVEALALPPPQHHPQYLWVATGAEGMEPDAAEAGQPRLQDRSSASLSAVVDPVRVANGIAPPGGVAEGLFAALHGGGGGVLDALAPVDGPAAWAAAAASFANEHPLFCCGDLGRAVRQVLAEGEAAACDAVLQRRGVDVLYTPQRDVAEALRTHRSPDDIVAALEHLDERCGWGVLEALFSAGYTDIHGGDAAAALAATLPAAHHERCDAILERKGASIKGGLALGAAVRKLRAAVASCDAAAVRALLTEVPSRAAFQKLSQAFEETYPGYHQGKLLAALVAQLPVDALAACEVLLGARKIHPGLVARWVSGGIARAVERTRADEAGVLQALAAVSSEGVWLQVVKVFAAQQSCVCSGDVVAALRQSLSVQQLAKCGGVLAGNNVSVAGLSVSAAYDRAAALHAAMAGFGTDERAIYAALLAVTDAADWAHTRQAFAEQHDSFQRGDLVAALKGELSAAERQKCEVILRRCGAELDSAARCERIAEGLYEAMKGFGADAEGIYRQLQGVADRAVWQDVKAAFTASYPQFHSGDVVAALRSELTAAEQQKCEAILRKQGVAFAGAATPEALASALYAAMKGFGTDEAAVYTALRAVEGSDGWRAVQHAFAEKHSEFHGGDVVAALKAEMTLAEWGECTALLKAQGVADGAAAEGGAASALGIANGLFHAVNRVGSDEAAVFTVLAKVHDEAAWREVKDVFASAHAEHCRGDLVQALLAGLSEAGAVKCNALLTAKQLTPLSAAAAHPVAEGLYKAMKGVGTNENAVYRLLASVKDTDDWDQVRRSFHAAYPSFHGGDLAAALQRELVSEEVAACRAVLRSSGIGLSDPTPAAAAQQRARQLRSAVLNWGDDEDAVFAVLRHVTSQEAWAELGGAFAALFPEWHGGDVVRMLEAELPPKEVATVETYLQRSSVALRSSSPDLSHATAEHITTPVTIVPQGDQDASIQELPSAPKAAPEPGLQALEPVPDAPTSIDGYYSLHTQEWNGRPVWVDANGGPQCVFVNNSGKWTISTKREHMARSTGWVKARRAGTRHTLPHEVSEWRSNDGRTWGDDPHVRVVGWFKMMVFDEAAQDWAVLTHGSQLRDGARVWVGEGGREFHEFAARMAYQPLSPLPYVPGSPAAHHSICGRPSHARPPPRANPLTSPPAPLFVAACDPAVHEDEGSAVLECRGVTPARPAPGRFTAPPPPPLDVQSLPSSINSAAGFSRRSGT